MSVPLWRRRGRSARYFGHFVLWLYVAPLFMERFGVLDERMMTRLMKRLSASAFNTFDITYTCLGTERLAGDQARIYIANHRSWMDQGAVILAVPELTRFLGKSDYFSVPVLGKTMKMAQCIPVYREHKARTVELMEEVLASGGSLVLYPEGTRSETDEFLPFRSGAFVLSAKTGAPIVPLYIHGAHDVLPRAVPFSALEPGRIVLDVGEPFVVPESFLDDPNVKVYEDAFIEAYHHSRERSFTAHGGSPW